MYKKQDQKQWNFTLEQRLRKLTNNLPPRGKSMQFKPQTMKLRSITLMDEGYDFNKLALIKNYKSIFNNKRSSTPFEEYQAKKKNIIETQLSLPKPKQNPWSLYQRIVQLRNTKMNNNKQILQN